MSITSQKNKGWQVTFASTFALLAIGVLYAWSVFKANIPQEWGWSETQKSLPYSIACVSLSIMVIVGARLLDYVGPRVVVSLGGLLAGLGVIITSQSTSPLVVMFAFGVMVGSGIGFVYGATSPAALRWFPASRTGLISGIVVAGFGLGSAWMAPLAQAMIVNLGLQSTLLYLGIGILIVVVALAQLICFPPKGFDPGGNKPTGENLSLKIKDFSPGDIVKTWQFFFLWISFALSSGAGLMVIGNLASIVSEQVGLVKVSGIAVAALSIGNGGGRVLYGILSDKFGRKNVLLGSFLFQVAVILSLSAIQMNSPLATVPILLTVVVIIGANYGATFAIYPAITKEYFGTKNYAVNFSIVFTAWGFGGFLLSQIAGILIGSSGSYNLMYLLAAGILILGAVLIVLNKSPQQSFAPLREGREKSAIKHSGT